MYYRKCILDRIDNHRLVIFKYQRELHGRKLSPFIHESVKRYYDWLTKRFQTIQEFVDSKDTDSESLKKIDNRLVQNPKIKTINEYLRISN